MVGLSGTRSSLVAEVIKAAAASHCKLMLLENVGHIISTTMSPVFFEIIAWLSLVGMTIIRWGVITAGNVGSPQTRGMTYGELGLAGKMLFLMCVLEVYDVFWIIECFACDLCPTRGANQT